MPINVITTILLIMIPPDYWLFLVFSSFSYSYSAIPPKPLLLRVQIHGTGMVFIKNRTRRRPSTPTNVITIVLLIIISPAYFYAAVHCLHSYCCFTISLEPFTFMISREAPFDIYFPSEITSKLTPSKLPTPVGLRSVSAIPFYPAGNPGPRS